MNKMKKIQGLKDYYEERIDFVVEQYNNGRIKYEDIHENKDKLIRLLNDAIIFSDKINNNKNFRILNNLINKN